MLTKELGILPLCGLPLRGLEDQIDQLVILNVNRATIDFEEQQRRFQSDSLVSVDERVILHQMKQIRRRHLTQVFVKSHSLELR